MSLGPNEPEVIIFERSPFGNLDAIVQQDGRSLYFYLAGPEGAVGSEGAKTKACWLGNLVKGPLEINTQEMEAGIPPLLPRIHCNHPDGRSLPQESELEVVWFEEGNGVAILESGSVLGVIPPWSGVEGFDGYARDCIAETQVAWPLPDTDSLNRRIANAKSFWDSMETDNPFGELQPQILEAFQQRFGDDQNYWAIDGNQFPPRGLVQLQQNEKTTLVTVGMSLLPLPDVEMYVENPSLHRRIELACQVDSALLDKAKTEQIVRTISGLAKRPWEEFTWFGHQHTCELYLEAFPNHPYVILWADSRVPIGNYRGDPIHTLWLIPISEVEMQSLRDGDHKWTESEAFKKRLPF